MERTNASFVFCLCFLVAFGASQLIQRRSEPARAKQLLRFAAFPSSVVASSANCYIVRSPELETGIPLLNEDHEEVLPGAVSHAAASAGVASTVFSRAVLQAPVYFLPPLLMSTIGPLKRYLVAHPAMCWSKSLHSPKLQPNSSIL